MGDPIINSTPQVQQQAPVYNVPATTEPKKSGGFGRVLGNIFGGVASVMVPGLGGVIGGMMGRGNGANTADMQAMMDNQMRQSMQLLSVQNRVQSQSQEFTTFSNLLKSKHDSEMSAVTNFKT